MSKLEELVAKLDHIPGPDGIWVELNHMIGAKGKWEPIATVLTRHKGFLYGASYVDALRYEWLGEEECQLTEQHLRWLKSLALRIERHMNDTSHD